MEFLSSIAASVVTSILEHCSAPIAGRVSYFMNIKQRIDDLKDEMEQLTSTMNEVISLVEAEEQNLRKRTYTVQQWLENSTEIINKSRAIVNEYEQREMQLIGCCPSCRLRYRIGKEAFEMYKEVAKHEERKPSDRLTMMPPPGRVVLVEVPRIEGQIIFNHMIKQILDWIRNEQDTRVNSMEVEVIGVYGMGGVGKTTLMGNINNKLQESNFDVVIMITVSQNPDFENIRRQIKKRLGVTEMIEVDDIMSILRRKKYLLILDDVWKAFDLKEIGVPQMNNDKNSKIIVAGRDEHVCINMGVRKHKIEVKCLVEKEAWSLFKKTIGDSLIERPSIQPHVMNVLKWCGGLPLAIVTVARAMVNRNTQREWEDANRMLRQLATGIGEIEEKVLVPLKFSYDRLRSNCHRDCFLYCCIYPEDFRIFKIALIDFWFGEGLLGESWNLISDARSEGQEIIRSLVESGMLEIDPQDEDRVRMDDVMRELAVWITSKETNGHKVMVLTNRGLREAPKAKEWKLANRISLTENEICTLPQLQECPQLSTLWLDSNKGLKEIPSIGFFECMPALRVLDLGNTSISSLPPSFSQLVNLRVLLLYNTSQLKKIPHIGSLQQLIILNLSMSGIMELPEGFDSLINLRRLNISHTLHLSRFQPGIITKLSSLEELEMWHCGWDLGVVLEDLKYLDNLSTLYMSTSDTTLVQGNALSILKSHQQLKINLKVSNCKLTHFPPFNNLIYLNMDNCDDIDRVFSGEEGNSLRFQRLERLRLNSLQGLLVIYDGVTLPGGSFSNLKIIQMFKCPKTKNLFSTVIMPHLQSLSEVDIRHCDELEVIFRGEEAGEIGLPSLKRLTLFKLSELTSISPCVLNPQASLQFVWVADCPKLNKLPLGTHHNQCLKRIEGKGEWWDGLQWEDENIKSSLQPFFFKLRED